MSDKEHEDKDDDDAREDDDNAKGDRNAGVAFQPQRPAKQGKARGYYPRTRLPAALFI